MKKKFAIFLSSAILMSSIFAYKAWAYNFGSTDLYATGPASFVYTQTTRVDDYLGYSMVIVRNRIYVNGSLYDSWSQSAYAPEQYCNSSKSYPDCTPILGTTLHAYTDRYLENSVPDRTAQKLPTTDDTLVIF